MIGKLIVSIDCEGRWGIADRNYKRLAAIENKSLTRAYQEILKILERHEAKATFGFVAALCLDEEELINTVRKCGDLLRFGENDWLAPPRKEMEACQFSGWSAPNLINLVLAAGRHHICSHGGFHIPYAEGIVSSDAIAEDIILIKKIESRISNNLNVLIYPRNIIGFKSLLVEAGFRGYRQIDRRELASNIIGKAERVINEFVSTDRNDFLGYLYRNDEGMHALSPGKFLNARIGIRKLVPVMATMKRIDCLLNAAVENGSVVHFYTHPHNFISDSTMVDKFDYLFSRARDFERQGKLSIVTMGDELNEAEGL